MSRSSFFGRDTEINQLKGLSDKSSASLIVVKGRRRIGKSRLIEEFGKAFKTYIFSGLPPQPETTLENQLHEFGWQLGKAFDEPAFKDNDWNDLFLRLASKTRKGKVLILFDEISWMGSKDPHFLGKLKNAWDLEFKKNPQLVLALCGSVSTWIEKNILSSTGFLGRISLNMTLEELPIFDCNSFWADYKDQVSSYEKFKILAVTGGIPKYLEEIKPNISAEENIKQLCFDRSGLLFNEFEHIFSDIFGKRSSIYKDIVLNIADGYYEYEEIYKRLNVEKSGLFTEYLDDLAKSGFVRRCFTWDLKKEKKSKLSQFRISDNYLRFYLKTILPNKDKIENNAFREISLSLLPQWESIMGLQFENLILHNREKILKILNVSPEDVIYDNPYFQHQTTRNKACQIDYLIQTRHGSLYVCEIKFRRKPISSAILKEVQEKMDRLSTPRYVSRRAVLIHVNGVSDKVAESRYFSHIIDFSQLLKQ